MERIPSATNLRRVIEYCAVAAIVAFFLAPAFLPPGILLYGAVLVIVVGALLCIALGYMETRKYGFDERGVYRRGRLMFSWSQVKRLSLEFRNRSRQVTLVARPTWAALVSGGPFEDASYIDYGMSLDFELEGGGKVEIPSNLDRLAGSVVERIDGLAKSANPRIVLE